MTSPSQTITDERLRKVLELERQRDYSNGAVAGGLDGCLNNYLAGPATTHAPAAAALRAPPPAGSRRPANRFPRSSPGWLRLVPSV